MLRRVIGVRVGTGRGRIVTVLRVGIIVQVRLFLLGVRMVMLLLLLQRLSKGQRLLLRLVLLLRLWGTVKLTYTGCTVTASATAVTAG